MDRIDLVFPEIIGKAEKNIYGVFAEHIGGVIYDGIYVGEDSTGPNVHGFRKEIIVKMKKANIPLVRWPGGCFAEVYDWMDGIGPKEERPTRVSCWTMRDGRYEPNLVGTDEFLDFCEQLGAEAYIAANITSTTPMHIRKWIDYCNSPAGTTTLSQLRESNGHKEPYNVKLWGVGNETWGGGGNMTPESYAMEYRRYREMMFDVVPGLELILSGANAGDISWTRQMLSVLDNNRGKSSGMSFHYYCGNAGDTVNFTEEEWYRLLSQAGKMDELIRRHWAAVVSYKMEDKAKLCIDEWGCWHPEGTGPSKGYNLFEQQSTMRDAVVTAMTLNIFNNHCEKIKLCTVAQLVNNLHCLFLSAGENCICTPTYHVFDMMQYHQDATVIRTIAECDGLPEDLPGLSVSASMKDGMLTVTAANLSATEDREVSLVPFGGEIGKEAEIITLGDGDIHAYNTFEQPERVVPTTKKVENFSGVVSIPAGGVVTVRVSLK